MRYRLREETLKSQLGDLEVRRQIFDHLPLDPLHAEWFRHRAWVRTIHGTTRIEGNSLSDVEVEEVLASSPSRFPRQDALEVLGTQAALEFVDEVAPHLDVAIGEPLIREIHRRVLDGIDELLTPGEYRRGNNRVTDGDGNTIFTTPPSGDVPDLMRQFGLWLGAGFDERPAPVAAALAHLEFVAIHPFYDGNGRTARALARLFLVRHGYSLGGLVSLDAYLDQDRRDYFAAIKQATGGSYEPGYDATPFVSYFLGALIGAADHVLKRMKGLHQVLIALRRDIASEALPAPLLDGLAYAWINRSLRPADYIRITGRTKQSASGDLQAAVKLRYLVARGETKRRRYLLGPAFGAIGMEAPASSPADRLN